jgi:hypothetical protein
MDTIPSAEFRKVYAKLTETIVVTVNGHAIGTWRPVNAPVQVFESVRLAADEDVVDHRLGTPAQQAVAASRLQQGKPGTTLIEPTYSSRPFTPAPKR